METVKKSTRYNVRTKLQIPLEVSFRESAEVQWTENTQTEDVTICGAGFKLSRPIEIRRLVQLSMPMPGRFRLFGLKQRKYNVCGLVRYVRIINPNINNGIRVMVGVAFTGGSPPNSFIQNPQTLYDLKPLLRKESFWDLRERPRNAGSYARSSEERFLISIAVILQIFNDDGKIIETVDAQTLNISESGMALVANFTADSPHYVLVKTLEGNTVLLAAVRAIHLLDSENTRRLHLEFISGNWRFD